LFYRYFSLYNHIKTYQRYSLKPATVEAYVRMAATDDDGGSALRATLKWVENGHSRSDDERIRPRKSKKDENKEDKNDDWFKDVFDNEIDMGI
jgi:hypothetical protein